jgi:hypothetical protein
MIERWVRSTPCQFERIVDAEVFEHLVIRHVLNPDQHIAGEIAEACGQRSPGVLGETFKVVERGWDSGHRRSILASRSLSIGLEMED